MTSSQHSAVIMIASGVGVFCAIRRNRRQVRHLSTQLSTSLSKELHHAFRRISIRVLSALRCAPRTPTWHCRNTHCFQFRTEVAFPAGTTGSQTAPRGPGLLTRRSITPSGPFRYPSFISLKRGLSSGSMRWAANQVARSDVVTSNAISPASALFSSTSFSRSSFFLSKYSWASSSSEGSCNPTVLLFVSSSGLDPMSALADPPPDDGARGDRHTEALVDALPGPLASRPQLFLGHTITP